jgi:hypothetical protein
VNNVDEVLKIAVGAPTPKNANGKAKPALIKPAKRKLAAKR